MLIGLDMSTTPPTRRELQCDAQGRLIVSGATGSNGGGTSDTTEVTQLAVKSAVEALNAKFAKARQTSANSASVTLSTEDLSVLNQMLTAMQSVDGALNAGRAAAAASVATVLSTEDKAVLDDIAAKMLALTNKFPNLFGSTISTVGQVFQATTDTTTVAGYLANYNYFSGVSASDFVTVKQFSNGQAVTALSSSPLVADTESTIVVEAPVKQPCSVEIEASVIRARHQFASMGVFANADAGPAPVPDPINVVSIYQSTADFGAVYNAVAGAIVTITLDAPLPGIGDPRCVYLSDWVHVVGLVDTRLNYQNLAIKYISADRKTITGSYADDTVIPTLAIPLTSPPADTVKLYFYNNLAGASDGLAIRFSGTTTTSAAVASLFNGGDVKISGTLISDHRLTMGSTIPVYNAGTTGNIDITATTRYRLDLTPDVASVADKPIDLVGGVWTHRVLRTAVKPNYNKTLRPRLRLYCAPGLTRPVAKIISVSKAGSTTWTVTHDGAYPFQTGNYVTLKGNRDQTNFAGFTSPTGITVVDATHFTLVGTTGTAVGYGGSVILCNGAVDQPGIIGMAVNNVTYSAASGMLSINANATITGLNIGDYIDLHGVRAALNGNDLGIDGPWEVFSVSTTFIMLAPVYDVQGVRRSPVIAGDIATVNAGGTFILRTTLRAHDLVVRKWDEVQVKVEGQGTGRADLAMPIYAAGGTLNGAQGTALTLGTDGTGGWYLRPGIASVADVVSAAITVTTTGAAVANVLGNAYQLVFAVASVSGTTPAMDVAVEESFDGGTNWVRVYEFARITTSGTYYTPVLFAIGRHYRVVQTLSGTTPSFTRAINRVVLPFQNVKPFHQVFDRAIALATLSATSVNLFAENCANASLVVVIGAATTPPTLKLQGSDDAVNWYDLPSGSVAAVASSAVQVTVNDIACRWVRAVVSSAGAAVTSNFILLKAF